MQKLILFLFAFVFVQYIYSQNDLVMVETPTVSGGAEYSQMLEKLKLSGNEELVKYNGIPYNLEKTTEINLITTIEGINFNEDASNSGFFHIPPDPHGAAGPSHLVSVVNTSIEWHTKAGVQQNSQSLASFFSSLGPLTGTFDPKVIYDQYNSRFVVVTLEQASVPQRSRIYLAVSKTSDPNSGWWYLDINSLINISGNSWADYPGLSVGTDAIYITANMFRFTGSFAGSRLWIIAKSLFYSGGTATVTVHNPYPSGQATTYQPAHMFGSPQTNVGTFLIAYSGLSNGTNEFVNVVRIDNPLGTPSFNFQQFTLGNIDNTLGAYNDAPQLGTAITIMTNDRRTQNAVWRNNSLWSAFTVVPTSGVTAGEVTAHWIKINTTTLASLSVSDQGNIGGESIATNCYTFFPSIAVNSSNAVVIGFSASASTIYPGCYYTGRLSSDPAGFTITPDVVRLGLDYYNRTFGSGNNRWGDYSGSSVDPSDDQTFYVFNQYALTRGNLSGGEDGRWGTVFGVVPVSVLPVELSSFTAIVLRNGGVQLDWTTETEVDNYGFNVERTQLAGSDTLWEKLGFVEGHGNSNSPKEYTYTDNFAQYGNYAYRLKQIDTDGSFEYSDIIEVEAGNIPDGFVLEQNYPNPFNPTTSIKFALTETQLVELKVFDVLGNEVAIVFNGIADGGKIYEAVFNAEKFSSGIYFYQLETSNRVVNKKMLLLK